MSSIGFNNKHSKEDTFESRLLRRLGHMKFDAILEIEAIFEG